MKRFAVLIVTVTFVLNAFATGVFADAPASGTAAAQKIMLYVKPDVSVELNGVRKIFSDVNGQRVYPLIYNGTTYLPVRAVSALMREPVEWDSGYKTVFIGKTLTYPNKVGAPIPSEAAVSAKDDETYRPGSIPGTVTGYLKPDVLVMYDFDFQYLQDAKGNTVYPVNYNGSIYLPIRAVSNLMNASIKWDGTSKNISITAAIDEEEESGKTTEQQTVISALSLQLKGLFEREEILYYEATTNITSLKNAASLAEKQSIAFSASENFLGAQSLAIEIKQLEQADFTEEELAAYEKLVAFTEINEQYILTLENIAYLAASDQDYSMLAEMFLFYAGESKIKMDEAGEYIRFLTTAE